MENSPARLSALADDAVKAARILTYDPADAHQAAGEFLDALDLPEFELAEVAQITRRRLTLAMPA